MHELSIAMSILDIAAEEAQRRQAQVLAVHLKVGPLSGVVLEALQSAYELAREGTPLDGARLVIKETPITMNCPTCADESPVASLQQLCCARCGSPAMDIASGRELEITAMEIEE